MTSNTTTTVADRLQMGIGRSRKSKYHRESDHLIEFFHVPPRRAGPANLGMQLLRSKAAATWIVHISGGWIDVAAQRSERDELAVGDGWRPLELIRRLGLGQFTRATICRGCGLPGLPRVACLLHSFLKRHDSLSLLSIQHQLLNASTPPSVRFSTSAPGLTVLLIRWISSWGSENRRPPCWAMQLFMRVAAAVGLWSSCGLSLDAPAMRISNPQTPITQWPSQCQRLEKYYSRLHSRAKYISTSVPRTGPTSFISIVGQSCQHIDDLSSNALGPQICGHPPHSLSNSIKANGRTAPRFVGKQRHREAVRDGKYMYLYATRAGGLGGGSSTRDGPFRKPAWDGASRTIMEHLEVEYHPK